MVATSSRAQSFFQEGGCNANDRAGCSSEKEHSRLADASHSVAARSAITVSQRTRSVWANLGKPAGFDSSRNGGGPHLPFGRGRSRALEKVAQFGPQCWQQASAARDLTLPVCNNTSLSGDMSMSHGSCKTMRPSGMGGWSKPKYHNSSRCQGCNCATVQCRNKTKEILSPSKGSDEC